MGDVREPSVKGFSVEDELKKNPDIKMDVLETLRTWLKTQPHLPEQHITDQELILAYHSCERSMEVAKQTLELHFTLRTHLPCLKPMELEHRVAYAKSELLTLLPGLSPDGYSVVYSTFIDTDPKRFNLVDTARYFVHFMDLWLFERGTSPGFVFLVDLRGVTLQHLTKLDITTMQHFLYFLQGAVFCKLKSVHFLNAPSFSEHLLRLIRPLLRGSLLSMVHVHSGGEVAAAAGAGAGVGVRGDALPEDAGGKWWSVKRIAEDSAVRMSNEEFFKQQALKVVDETRRVGKVTHPFGVEGSFRKLDID